MLAEDASTAHVDQGRAAMPMASDITATAHDSMLHYRHTLHSHSEGVAHGSDLRDASDHCGIRPVSNRLHLWTITTARQYMLLDHWLTHYAAQGVWIATNAHVTVHKDFASERVFQATRRVLEAHRVSNVHIHPSVNATQLEGSKLRRLNHFIQNLPKDAWLILPMSTNSSPIRAT